MTGAVAYRGTIPGLLASAADRDGDGVWLRSDSGSLTFGGAAAAAGLTADALTAAGVRRGDLVMMTARTTPPFLICWLALAALGAVTVAVNPRSSAAELAGLAAQVGPRALITDAGLAALVAEAGVGSTAPGSGRPDTGVLDTAVLDTAVLDTAVLDTAVLNAAVLGTAVLDVVDLVPADWADLVAMAGAARRATRTRCWARWPAGPAWCSWSGSRPAVSWTRRGGTGPPSSMPSGRCWRS